MSPLILALALSLADTACTGSHDEVPTALVGWADDDEAWLARELSGWVRERGHTRCDGAPGLRLELGEHEVLVRFELDGAVRTRTLPRAGPVDELLRYQTAATAEELVRSTWEAPAPPRFAVVARAAVFPTVAGPVLGGGAIGVAVFALPSLAFELHAGAAVLGATPLIDAADVRGALFSGTASLSWLPVRLGVFRAGPRASAQVGALSLEVRVADTATASGVVPWVWLGGGLSAGVEVKRFSVSVIGEFGAAVVGGAVLLEGAPTLRLPGASGMAAVQAGWSW